MNEQEILKAIFSSNKSARIALTWQDLEQLIINLGGSVNKISKSISLKRNKQNVTCLIREFELNSIKGIFTNNIPNISNNNSGQDLETYPNSLRKSGLNTQANFQPKLQENITDIKNLADFKDIYLKASNLTDNNLTESNLTDRDLADLVNNITIRAIRKFLTLNAKLNNI